MESTRTIPRRRSTRRLAAVIACTLALGVGSAAIAGPVGAAGAPRGDRVQVRGRGTGPTIDTAPGPDGTTLTYALVRSTTGPARGAVLILPGSDGMRSFYLRMAQDYANAGLDAVVGCWFATPDPSRVPDWIPCPNGPRFTGVSPASVPVVRSFVTLTRRLTDVPASRLGVVGYSRGGGAALLWAARTHTRIPITNIAGMVDGTVQFNEVQPEERVTNPTAEVSGIRAPVLFLHSLADGIVTVRQSVDLESRLEFAGRRVATHWYDNCGNAPCNHDWLFNDEWRADLIARSSAWTISRTELG